jgi:FKBP-type peptidyl-prolyl cis-trans isomerase 2
MGAQNGDTVKVHWTGKLESGEVFATSREGLPPEITLGKEQIISGFEKGIMGMEPGDTKTFKVSPEEAFGPRREALIINVKKSDFPEKLEPSVGERLQVNQPDGGIVEVRVAEVREDEVSLDANHPLAGKTLEFDVELVEIAGG